MGLLEQWGSIDLNLSARGGQNDGPGKLHPGELQLVSMEGVVQHHSTFTREDVQLAADGVADQTYRTATYVRTGGFLLMTLQTGNKMDGRCTVTVSRLKDGVLRFYENKCTNRQAVEWFLAFYDGRFSPEWREWKDVTRKVIK